MPVIDQIKNMFSSGDKKEHPTSSASSTAPASAAAAPESASTGSAGSEQVAFDSKLVTVIFVLGGPGAGKGTQCEGLVRDYGFKHLSAGDLLRAEQQREGSTYGAMIKEYITEGKIVPMEVTVKLLENAMRAALASPPTFSADSPLSQGWENGKGRFLIDGFPRKMDQAHKFDDTVCKSSFVLFFKTTEDVLLARLMERGKTSGRDDDNVESIKKRFRTFVETSMPVVDYYRTQGKVVEIDSTPAVEVVYKNVRAAMDERLAGAHSASSTSTSTSTTAASAPTATSGSSEAAVAPQTIKEQGSLALGAPIA